MDNTEILLKKMVEIVYREYHNDDSIIIDDFIFKISNKIEITGLKNLTQLSGILTATEALRNTSASQSGIKSKDVSLTQSSNYFTNHINNISVIVKSVYEIRKNKNVELNMETINEIESHVKKKKKYAYDEICHLLENIVLTDSQVKHIYENQTELETIVKQKTEDKANNIKNELYVQLIGIIGIFTSIIFAIFGGINAISSVSTNLSTIIKLNKSCRIYLINAFIALIFILITIGAILGLLYLFIKGITCILRNKK